MQVTFVASTFQRPDMSPFPGAVRYSRGLTAALANLGVSVRVVVPAGKDRIRDTPSGVEVVQVKGLASTIGRAANIGQGGMLSFTSRLAKSRWLTKQTDIVHSTVPLLAIDTIRDVCPVIAFSHHVEAIRRATDLLTVPFGNSYGSYMYRRADAVVTPSNASATRVVRQFGVSPAKVRVIYHGIDTTTFFRDHSLLNNAWDGRRRFILFVGAMNARKNVLFLIDAFDRLVREMQDLQLVLVGSGPLDRDVDRMVRRPSLSGRVTRLAGLCDDELRRLYSSASVFAWPSLDEGFGFAPVEAMASGAPVVALDTPVNKEVLGDAGIFVSGTSSGAFADTLKRLLDDPEVARGLSKRGLGRVRERYSWAVAASKYVQVYTEVLNTRSAT